MYRKQEMEAEGDDYADSDEEEVKVYTKVGVISDDEEFPEDNFEDVDSDDIELVAENGETVVAGDASDVRPIKLAVE